MESESFHQLLEQCGKRQLRAQMKFYALFSREVYNTCFRILSDAMDAEEVTQDVFLKFLGEKCSFSGNKPALQTYLRRMAVNRSVDMLRRRHITWISLDSIPEDMMDESNVLDNEMYDLEKIRLLMEQLPNGYRLVLTLHLLEEMEYVEIAETLHVTPSTVRSQYVRAIAALRKKYKDDGNEYGKTD